RCPDSTGESPNHNHQAAGATFACLSFLPICWSGPVISHQSSVISHQSSVISYQLSVISDVTGHRSPVTGHWSLVTGHPLPVTVLGPPHLAAGGSLIVCPTFKRFGSRPRLAASRASRRTLWARAMAASVSRGRTVWVRTFPAGAPAVPPVP